MYISDRLFSEASEEVFYSVVMNEEEYNLYSEFLYSVTSEDIGAAGALTPTAVGAVAAGAKGGKAVHELRKAGLSWKEIGKVAKESAKAGAKGAKESTKALWKSGKIGKATVIGGAIAGAGATAANAAAVHHFYKRSKGKK